MESLQRENALLNCKFRDLEQEIKSLTKTMRDVLLAEPSSRVQSNSKYLQSQVR